MKLIALAVRMPSAAGVALMLCLATTLSNVHGQAVDLFVLRTNDGSLQRIATDSADNNSRLIRGLVKPLAMTRAEDGCWIIAQAVSDDRANVIRFDPRDGGHVSVLIDVPEGYGGQLAQPSSFAWHDGDLLVADQADRRVKRYAYPSGEWQSDAVATSAAAHEIVVANQRLYCFNRQAKTIQRSGKRLDRRAAEIDKAEDWITLPKGEQPASLIQVDDGLLCITVQGSLWRLTDHDDGSPESECLVAGDARLTDVVGASRSGAKQFSVLQRSGKLTEWNLEADPPAMARELAQLPDSTDVVDILYAEQAQRAEFVYQPTLLTTATQEKIAFFEQHIRPLLHEHCLECHGNETQEGRLRLDRRVGWQAGGRSGSAIVPGKPEQSLLIQAVLHLDKDLKMPPDHRLPLEKIDLLTQWVRSGAIDPREAPRSDAQSNDPKSPPTASSKNDAAPSDDTWAAEFTRRLDWWSLKPMRRDDPPAATSAELVAWSDQPIDRFIQQRLTARGLQAAEMASDEVLLRRVAFVLTGLPPSPAIRSEFLQRAASDREAGYRWLVEELLQSPHFGEQWARHWMDVVRYTDTYGYEWDNPAKGSHEYRDYLIRAFNQDLPFDQFVIEQLAGDLLTEPRIDQALGINESMIGPMFYHLGEHRHGSSLAFNGIHQEMIHNKVDAFSKAFLATTVACARCHDHKREPVSQRDYYALGAMFMTPRWVSRPADAPGKHHPQIEKLRTLRSSIREAIKHQWVRALGSPEFLRAELIEQIYQAHVQQDKPPKITIDDIEYPIVKLLAPEADLQPTWQALAKEYQQTRKQRVEANQAFRSLWPRPADATSHSDDAGSKPKLPEHWVMEGEGFEHGWAERGEILIALEGDQAIANLLERGLHSHALSSKLPGVLRMPAQHTVPGNRISLQLAGGQFSGSLVLDENTFQNETVAFFKNDKLAWRTYADQPLKNGVTRCTIDFATAPLNANFPPRTGLAAGLPNNDLGFDKRSWLSITQIVSHDQPGAPQNELDAFVSLFEMETQGAKVSDASGAQTSETATELATRSQIVERLSAWLRAPVERWCQDRCLDGDCDVINWLLHKKLLPNSPQQSPELERLVAEYREVENRIAFPRTVNSMDERSIDKAGLYLNVRGNVDAMERLVMPAGLSMFGDQASTSASLASGRLELAQSLVDPEHPLLARVYVNRLWQWVMGEGLVATPDDFGRLGQQPTHPELLDWLAREFIRQGWSTKHLVRQMVLSQTFRESGEVKPEARERDPANQLRHHYPTRRLEAESIRDSLLAVSGRLDRSLFGRPINPPRSVEDGAKRLYSGPVDGQGRRSLYLTMSIMAPPKFLTTFDLPDLKLPNGKRNVTNVPAQALQMMNDPLVSEMASVWSSKLQAMHHTSIDDRITDMFIAAYARPPQPSELELWRELARQLASTLPNQADPDQTASDPIPDTLLANAKVWTQVAQTMFNTQEFIHYR